MNGKVCIIAIMVLIMTSCGGPEEHLFTVENKLNFARKEVVAIASTDLKSFFKDNDLERVLILDPQTSQYLITQLVDKDLDGKVDELLFQAEVRANSISNFKIESKENAEELKPVAKVTTYSRFVPERIDDYAWENDKAASICS